MDNLISEQPITIESERFVHAEQIRLLYRQTTPATIGSPFAGALLIYLFRGVVENNYLFGWIFCLILVSVIRLMVSALFFRKELDQITILPWEKIYISGTVLHGSVWAIAWLFLIFTTDPAYHVYVVIWMIGLSASSISAYSVSLVTLLAFFIPVIIPGTIALMVVGQSQEVALGLAIILYSAVVLRAVVPINKLMLDAIRLNFYLKDEIQSRKKVEEQLQQLSLNDSLTGLANRRHMDEYLDTELKRAQRTLNPLSLVMVDIDCFKLFNDIYGHLGGDECLQRIGKIISRAVNRTSDLACRFGGEEFVLILPNTDANSAYLIAEELRKNVQALDIPHSGSELTGLDVVTISLGVATIIPEIDSTPSAIIQRADEALYKSKHNGRNQVAVDRH